jgi:hypothetical protein
MEARMPASTLLVVLLVLILLGVLPTWGHSAAWGWGPSGFVGLLVVLLVVLIIMGRL